MSIEIRPMTADEVEQSEFIRAYSFIQPDRHDLARSVESSQKFFPLDWSLASYEDGEMTAWLRMLPMVSRINGHGLRYGGIGPVVSLPQHRRKGHVGALLREALKVMRERGQVLSGLHTPHPTLYQRYGWEICSERRAYAFPPKEVALKVQPTERGRLRILSRDDWQQADRVYRQHSAQSNGALHRGEVWWRERLLSEDQPNRADIALWENGSGEPQGYVIYHQQSQPDEWMGQFWVRELFALTSDAYLNLIQYIVRHDIVKEIRWDAPADDPFLSVIDDARHVTTTVRYDLMNRICDLEQALRMRPPAGGTEPLSLILNVSDDTAPWNDGTWRIDVADGAVDVEKTVAAPQLSLTATTLAPIFNGYLSATAAAMTGRLDVHDADAIATADALFAVSRRPYCADTF